VATHPVAGVHRHRERADARQVDQSAQVLAVTVQDVPLGDGAGLAVVSGDPLDDLVRDGPQAGLLPDRLGAGAAQFDAVVGGGVVAGGEHGAGAVE
jgi:hypothetical protein